MELCDLAEAIPGLGIEPTSEQLNTLHQLFLSTLVSPQLLISGVQVKVILKPAKNVRGYEHLPETFVHLITRKGNKNERIFDRHRANRIHWIRCVLENRREDEICFFQYPEPNGRIRNYYWYKDEDFLVILERITSDYLVITGFCIDDRKKKEYYSKKEAWYKNSLK